MRASYVIAAYNDMTKVSAPGGDVLLLGLMAFVPRGVTAAAGHTVIDIGYGRVEGGAWYLLRSADGRYGLRQVVAGFPHPAVAIRTILVSPFPGDGGSIYFAGYDANKVPAHDTAWIVRTPVSAALGLR